MTREFDFYQLEDRVLLSGEGIDGLAGDIAIDPELMDALMAEAAVADGGIAFETAQNEQSVQSESPLADEAITDAALLDPARSIEVVFIDAGVEDAATLLGGLESDNEDTQWFVVELSGNEDGLTQITNALAGLSGVDAIHLVSHGDGSGVQIGNTHLDIASVEGRAGEIASWAMAMDSDADLLIYGCDLASTDDGQALIESLAALCDCDVAASDDATGHADLGGDWEFEYTVGLVESDVAFSTAAQQSWFRVLATVDVDVHTDTVNGTLTSIADLIANDGGDGISLREAVIAANADGLGHTFLLEAGIYDLSLTGSGEDAAATGDLDITSDITIVGLGAEQTTIRGIGGFGDRLFEVRQNTLTLENLTLLGGDGSSLGGGVYVSLAAAFDATDVAFVGNTTSSDGGAVYSRGVTNLDRVSVTGSSAQSGGGVVVESGTTTLTNVTISNNISNGDGGGILAEGGVLNVDHSTIANNTTLLGLGGGLKEDGGTVNTSNSIFADNATALIGVNQDVHGAISSGGNNIIEDSGSATGTIGSDSLGVDPGLAVLSYDGDNGHYVHEITTGSIAYNALGASVGVDQRNVDRDSFADIGAFEYRSLITSGIELNTDGGNDAYLLSQGGLSKDLTATTVEVRFAADPVSLGTEPTLISYNVGAEDMLAINYSSLASGLELDFGIHAIAATGADYYAELFDGEVHTLSVTWDNANGDWAVYIDGRFIESGVGLSVGETLDMMSGQFVIGNEQDGANSDYQVHQRFAGTVYDVRIWDEARTAIEIASGAAVKVDPGNLPSTLLANWQMDGFDGSNEVVEVVNGNNLTVEHATDAGFIASNPTDDLHIIESAANGTRVGLVVATESDTTVDLLVDGQFKELSPTPTVETTFNIGETFGGWTVSSGSVDVEPASFEGPNGSLVVDLSGGGAGNITGTSFATVVGQTYEVSFALDGNFSGGDLATKDLRVHVAGTSEDFAVTRFGSDWRNGYWDHRTLTFTATSTSTTLAFESLESSAFGAYLADVSVTAVPEEVSTILSNDSSLSYDATSGKFYKVVNSGLTWTAAQAVANGDVINGVSGNLATARSEGEVIALQQLLTANGISGAWIGGSDSANEGTWVWQDGSNDVFYDSGDVAGAYHNFGALEPSGGASENYAELVAVDGTFNDLGSGATRAYVIEWDADDVINNHTFTLADSANGRFAIDASTGEVTVADTSQLDFDTNQTHDITVLVTDAVGNASSEVMTIAIDDANDWAITAPSGSSTSEDTAIIYTGANAIQIDDGIVADVPIQVSLNVANGALTLADTNGITFVEGQNATTSFVIEGLESDINTALDGLRYDPFANYSGADTLSIDVAVAAGLEGHFTFDGGTANDQSAGTVINGAFVGNATTTIDGVRGEVLSVDGTGDYVEIPGMYSNPSNVTLATWFNATESGTVIALGNNVGINIGDNGHDLFAFVVHGAGNFDITASPGTLINDGNWHHVAFAFDDVANTQSLYLDGVLVASGTFTNSIDYSTGATTSIGGNATNSPTFDFGGLIDDTRVFTRALSADEIALLASDQAISSDSVAITINDQNDAPSFDAGDGIVLTPFGSGNLDSAQAVVVQPDGKLLVTGYTYDGVDYDMLLSRYNADGSVDTSFAGTGTVTLAIGPGTDYGNAITVQDDGKIVIAGYSYDGTDDRFAVARYNADGTLDATFGGGVVTTSMGAGNEVGTTVAVQSDGKIIVGGYSNSPGTNDFAIARYNTDGSLDTSFDGDGLVTTAIGPSGDQAYKLTIQSDGKILLAGHSFNGTDNDFALVRYLADGSLDTSFNATGIVVTPIGAASDVGKGVVVQDDGKILVSGTTVNAGNDFAVVRYNHDGSLDTTFDTDGIAVIDTGSSDTAYTLALQSDGKVVVVGSSAADLTVARLNADGSLDTTFNTTGFVTTNLGGADFLYDVTLLNDGSIVAVGRSDTLGDSDVLIARFNSDGTLDSRFDLANTLDGNATFVENGGSANAARMDADVTIFDGELSAVDDFGGATLELQRAGGQDASDWYASASGSSLSFGGGEVLLSGVPKASYGLTTGRLTLTFYAGVTNAEVNEVMQSLAYWNNGDNPPASVDIEWTFRDNNTGGQGSGGSQSVVGTTTIDITPQNDAPVLDLDANDDSGATGVNYQTNYMVGGPAVLVADTDAFVSDVDSATLQIMTVVLSGALDGVGAELLEFDTTGTSLNASYNQSNYTLTITEAAAGTGTVSEFAQVLRTITYRNTSIGSGTDRTVAFFVTDDQGAVSSFASTNIAFTSNAVPVVDLNGAGAGADNALNFTENAPPTNVAPLATIDDNGEGDITSIILDAQGFLASGAPTLWVGDGARVMSGGAASSGTFTFGATDYDFTYDGADAFTFINNAGPGDPIATTEAELLIRSIQYRNLSNNPSGGDVDFEFTVQDSFGQDSLVATSVVTVIPVNDAPTLDNTGALSLTTITEDDVNNPGNTIEEILTSDVSVPDPIWDHERFPDGIAITAVGGNGTWQYDIGAGWVDVGAVSTTNALLLVETDSLRYVPDAIAADLGTVTFNAWDQYTGTAGSKVDASTTGGATAFSDQVEVAVISVTAVNDAPTIDNLAGDVYNYTAGDGAVLIEQGADLIVGDVDSTDFDTGNLAVTISGGNPVEDFLAIRNEGTGAGQISFSGNVVSFGPTAIGTFAGGSGGADLVITLNASATHSAVEALIQNITFENATGTPTAGSREIGFTLNDGDDATTFDYDTTVNVLGNFNATVLDRFGVTSYSNNDGTQNWNAPWQELGEADGAAAGNVSISSGSVEIGGSSLLGPISISGDGLQRSADLTGAVSATLSLEAWRAGLTSNADISLQISNNGTNWTTLDTFDNGSTTTGRTTFTYDVTSHASATTFVRLEGSGTVGSLLISSGFFYADNIAIDYVLNARPSLTMPGAQVDYTENDGAIVIDSLTTIIDADSANFDGGILTVSLSAGGQAEDRLAIQNQGVGAGQVGISGSTVSYGGLTVGSFTGGTDGSTPLVVTFNSTATANIVESVARNITYENVSEAPSTTNRTVSFTVTDGDGGTSATVNELITVAAANDAPVLDDTGTMTLTDINEDDTNSAGDTVADIISSAGLDRITDVDSGAVEGIALIQVENGGGTWQYRTLGAGPWFNVGSVNFTNALLLDASSELRFVPDPDFVDPSVNIMLKAWDQTSAEVAGDYVDILGDGGTSAFSVADEIATLSVLPVNDPPEFNSYIVNNEAYAENSPGTLIRPSAVVTDIDSNDFDGGQVVVHVNSATASDWLRILPGGNVTLSGTNVVVSGTTIGVYSGGHNATDLVINLNSNADAANVTELVQQLAYANTSDAPSASPRAIDIQVSDGDGNASQVSTNMNLLSVQDNPIVIDEVGTLEFDGIDDVVIVSDSPSLQMTNTLTMEVWFQSDTIPTTDYTTIINKEGEYEIGLSTNGTISWGFDNVDPDWSWHDTGYQVTADQWTHVAVTYDNGLVNTYVNGNLVDVYHGSGAVGDHYPALNELAIGGRTNNPADHYFDGRIDDVRVWDTALTQTDIQTRLESTLVGNEAGLAGHWNFNEFDGVTANDLTTNGNHGSLVDGGAGTAGPQLTGLSVNSDGLLNVLASDGFMANDFDVDNDTLSFVAFNTSSALGVFTLQTSGAFTYDANGAFDHLLAGDVAYESFSYSLSDGQGNLNSGVATIRVVGVNDAPDVTMDAGNATFTENSAAYIDGALTITDADSADFDTGALTVSISNNGETNDRLRVLPGLGVDVSGTDLTYLILGVPTVVATTSGGNGAADPLVITFNANADQAIVEAVARRVVFESTSNDPSDLQRTITMQLTDGDGGTSTLASRLMDVTATNDDPFNSGGTYDLSTFTVTEDVRSDLDLAFLGIFDWDARGADISVTFATSAGGNLYATDSGGVSVTGDGTNTLNLLGSVAEIEAFFNVASNVQYLHAMGDTNGVGADTISLTINDLGNYGVGGGGDIDVGTATVDITGVNDAPLFNTALPIHPTSITEDDVNNNGDLVSDIISSSGGGDRITDVDGDPEGFAIFIATNPNGTWQYSLDGGSNWTNIGSVSATNALLLRDVDRVRFVPNGIDGSSPTLIVRAWDQSAGNAGDKVDASTTGGSTPFSDNSTTARLTVTSVNDIPVVDLDDDDSGGPGLSFNTTFTEDNGAVLIADVDASITDIDDANLTQLQVVIVNQLDGSDEVLTADVSGTGLTANFVGSTLTVSGPGTVAEYEQVLQTIRYENFSENPDTTQRTLNVIASDASSDSVVAQSLVNVVSVNDAPVFFDHGFSSEDATFGGLDDVSFTGRGSHFADNTIVVDTNEFYTLNATAHATDSVGGPSPANVFHYLGFASYDIDDNVIHPTHVYRHAGSVDTTLAVELRPGDTQIVLSDATGWYDGGAPRTEHARSFAWYNYTDSTGNTYADYTYTRNVEVDLWDAGSISGNVITLRSAWTGPTIAAGDAVRNATSGGSYNYGLLSGSAIPDTPTEYTSSVGGGVSTGDYSSTLFRPGTHTIQAIALANYTPLGDPNDTDSVLYLQDFELNTTVGPYVSGFTTYTENGGAINILDGDAAITDVDDLFIESVTVELTNGKAGDIFQVNEAAINAYGVSVTGIQASPLAADGSVLLTLTADTLNSVTKQDFAEAIALIQFESVGENLDPTDRIVSFVANDGELDSISNDLTIKIENVNDAPVVSPTAGSGTLADINEDSTPAGDQVSDILSSFASDPISDVDGDPEGIAVFAANNTNGDWQYSTNGGATWTDFGAVSSSSGVVLDATARVRFLPNQDYFGNAGDITFLAWDQSDGLASGTSGVDFTVGTGGTSSLSTGSLSATLDVLAVNDQPVVDLDADDSNTAGLDYIAAFTAGDSPVAITDADALISDVDNAQLTEFTVVLTNILDGLSETLDADVSGTSITKSYVAGQLTLNGPATVAEFQQVLRSVTYHNSSTTPNTAQRVIEFTANDGTATSVVAEAFVNMTGDTLAPVEDANTGSLVSEGGTDTISNVELAFNDLQPNGNVNYTVTTAPANGFVALTSNPTVAIASFTQADIDNNDVIYVHDGGETTVDSFRFSVDDGQGNLLSGQSFNITVTPVNDAPVNTVSGPQVINEDSGHTFSPTVGDSDASATDEIQVTLSATNGTLSLGGLAGLTFTNGDGVSDTSMTFTGTIANVNAALSGSVLTTTQDFHGNATITLLTNDQGNSGAGGSLTDSDTINVTVNPINDDPTNTGSMPTDVSVQEDVATAINLSGIDLSDVDASTGNLTMTLTANAGGTLTATSIPGVTVVGSGGSSITLDGTLADLNAFIDDTSSIQYTTAWNVNGDDIDTIDVTINDNGNTGAGGGNNILLGTINVDSVAVNDDPVNTGTLPGTVNAVEDVASNVNLSAIDVYDADSATSAVTMTFATASGGTLDFANAAGVTVTGTGSSLVTLSGAQGALNTYLNNTTNIQFTGAQDVNGVAADAINITMTDNGNIGAGGGGVQSIGLVSVDIAAVNDAPVAAGEQYTTIGSQSVTLNTPLPQANDVDVDGDTMMVSIVGGPANGTLTVDGNGDFVYTPNAGFSGTESIQYVIDDGNATSNIVSMDIEVLPAPPGGGGGGGTDPGGGGSGGGPGTDPGDPPDEPEDNDPPETVNPGTTGVGGTPTGPNAEEAEQAELQQFIAVASQQSADALAESDELRILEGLFWNISSSDVEVIDEASAEVAMFERLLQLDLEQAIVWQQWDEANEHSEDGSFSFFVGTAGVGAGIFSIGYAFWALRGGAVLSMIASSLPAWRMIDPAALLEAYRRSVKVKQEGIESFFD